MEKLEVASTSEEVRSLRAVIATLVGSNEKLATANEKLATTNERLQRKIEELEKEVDKHEKERRAELATRPSTGGGEAEVCFPRDFNEAIKSFMEKDEKEHNLVILGAPEEDDDRGTVARDDALAVSMLRSCGVTDGELVETYRHGAKYGTRPRTLKLKFKHKNTPKVLLRVLRQRKLLGAVLPPHSRVRRDLTREEQERERALRKEAYVRNQQEKMFRWRVSDDLQLEEVTTPRPWRGAQGNNLPQQ